MFRSFAVLMKNNKFFFAFFALLVSASFCLLAMYSKEAGFVMLNPYHSRFLDKLFYFFTKLGNGWCMIIVAAIYFLLNRKKVALLVISSFLLSGLVAQVLKYIFPEARPGVLLEKSSYPYFIQHVTLHSYSSFPSGHSASAFAMAAVLAFYFPNKWWGLPLLIYACLVGYSRIYLGDHFLIDVLTGTVIGVLSAVLCWVGIERKFTTKKHKDFAQGTQREKP